MTVRRPAALAIPALAALIALAPAPARAESPALERAKALFAQNRWVEARSELRAQGSALPAEEQDLARLLIGRSLAREAEFYRAARAFASEVGLDYLRALAADPVQRQLRWTALFQGEYELAAGRDREAERTLDQVAQDGRLPEDWRALARLRRAVARHRLGQPAGTRALGEDRSEEARYWRAVLPGLAAASAPAAAAGSPRAAHAPQDGAEPARAGAQRSAAPKPPASAAALELRAGHESAALIEACLLLRAGKDAEAEPLLAGLELERPAVEDSSAPDKLLRFFDPLVLEVLEQIRWEQAAAVLQPFAHGGDLRSALSAFYGAWSRYQLGAREAARAQLAPALTASGLDAALQGRAQVLAAALAPPRELAAGELGGLWQRTQGDAESVLLWAELQAREWPDVQPLAAAIPARLEQLASAAVPLERASAGRWGIVRLRAGADAAEVAARLSKLRDNSSKNKIERNDPLLLLALAVANYRSAAYAQSLETLFALSQALPGLRGLHWNLQGVYAARQSAGGEARISP